MRWVKIALAAIVVGGISSNAQAFDLMRSLGIGYGHGASCCEYPDSCCNDVWNGYCGERRCWSLGDLFQHRTGCCESSCDDGCSRRWSLGGLFARKGACCESSYCDATPDCCDDPCSGGRGLSRLFSWRMPSFLGGSCSSRGHEAHYGGAVYDENHWSEIPNGPAPTESDDTLPPPPPQADAGQPLLFDSSI